MLQDSRDDCQILDQDTHLCLEHVIKDFDHGPFSHQWAVVDLCVWELDYYHLCVVEMLSNSISQVVVDLCCLVLLYQVRGVLDLVIFCHQNLELETKVSALVKVYRNLLVEVHIAS